MIMEKCVDKHNGPLMREIKSTHWLVMITLSAKTVMGMLIGKENNRDVRTICVKADWQDV